MYCRFESGIHPREPQADLLLATSDYVFSLDEHVKYLSKVATVALIYCNFILVFYFGIFRDYHL